MAGATGSEDGGVFGVIPLLSASFFELYPTKGPLDGNIVGVLSGNDGDDKQS